MSMEVWLAFLAATVVILVIPGPTIMLVIAYGLGHGRRVLGATVAGVALGDFTAMTASMLGMGALLAASAEIFTLLKWAGAAYLVWLGIGLWRAPVAALAATEEIKETSGWPAFLHAYAVTALNPKGLVFFVAFVPQFMDPARPLLPQIIVAEATFLVLAALNAASYGWLAASARRAIAAPAARRLLNRAGGTLLIGAGLAAVAWRKA
ncbi:MAG: LysE family translocator [Alphaproteobacteria bacterium]|nr:LysE family translocator [Alphaproteobacteria bacterium]